MFIGAGLVFFQQVLTTFSNHGSCLCPLITKMTFDLYQYPQPFNATLTSDRWSKRILILGALKLGCINDIVVLILNKWLSLLNSSLDGLYPIVPLFFPQ